MDRLTERNIILVTRPSRVAELERRFNTRTQARFYISRLGQDFSAYEEEDLRYSTAIQQASSTLARLGRLHPLPRSYLPNYVFGPQDIIVVLGQDGLVANTVKYLNGQPVIGVNPDPARYDGQLLPFKVADLPSITLDVLRGRRQSRSVTMAQATLNTGQKLYAVNDLFLGPRTHTSARYRITVGATTEDQSSSGIIVSTGVGSTGWLKSILAGATGVVRATATVAAPPAHPPKPPETTFPWDAPFLRFTVREPFPSKTTRTSLVFGTISADQPLHVESTMPENGVIFSDGIESDFLEFPSGTRAKVHPADRAGTLVV